MTAGDEEAPEEGEDNAEVLPYYKQSNSANWGCTGILWKFCLHFVVTHIALAVCLGAMLFGGEALIKGIVFLGWRSMVAVILDMLMAATYVVTVVVVVTAISRLGKKITKNERF